MSNAKIVFLTFYLLFSTPMHCMKRTAIDESAIVHINPTKPQTIQEIKNKHQPNIDLFKTNKFHGITRNRNAIRLVVSTLFQQNWDKCLKCCQDPSYLQEHKNFNIKKYSCLGLAVISFKEVTLISQEKENITYSDKKIFINQLIALGFKPTSEDLELAFLEKWERCKTVIQSIFFFHYTAPEIFLKLPMPQELIDYISLLMFETEESLL